MLLEQLDYELVGIASNAEPAVPALELFKPYSMVLSNYQQYMFIILAFHIE